MTIIGCQGTGKMKQVSLFDLQTSKTDPPCYTCRHALKRGNFRVCSERGVGYKHIGEKIVCNLFVRKEDDKPKRHKASVQVVR